MSHQHHKRYSTSSSRQPPYTQYPAHPPPYIPPPPPPPPTPPTLPSQYRQSQFPPPSAMPPAPIPQKRAPTVFARLHRGRSSSDSPPPTPSKNLDPNNQSYRYRQYPHPPPSSISSTSSSLSSSSSNSGSSRGYGSSSSPDLSQLHISDRRRRPQHRPRDLNLRSQKFQTPKGYKPPSVESAPPSPQSLATLSPDSKHVLDTNEGYFPPPVDEEPPPQPTPQPTPGSTPQSTPSDSGTEAVPQLRYADKKLEKARPSLKKSESWRRYPIRMYEGSQSESGSDSHTDSDRDTPQESSADSSPSGRRPPYGMGPLKASRSDFPPPLPESVPTDPADLISRNPTPYAHKRAPDSAQPTSRERRPYPSPQIKYKPPASQPPEQQSPRPSPQQRYQQTSPTISKAVQLPQPLPVLPQPRRDLSPASLESLPVCPGRNSLPGGKWYQMPSIPNFDVCMRCYYTHIYPSPFFQQLVSSEKPRATETSCSFSTQRILQKIWPSVMRTGNLGLLQDYALTRSNIPECHTISGNPMGALSSRWWKVADGSIPGFRCCDACYQDVVMATGFTSYFAPTNPQPGEDSWVCDLSFPFVAGGMLSVSAYQKKDLGDQWDEFRSIVEYRLRVMPCPGEGPTKPTSREWWTPKEPLPRLVICGACYSDNVVPHFAEKFVRHHPPPQQPVSCAMASFAIKAPWDCSVQKKSYEMWLEAIHAYMALPPCTDKGFSDQEVRGEWFTLQRHHKNLESFKCCRTCYYSLIRPLGLERYFDQIKYPLGNPPVTRICGLRSSGPRYAAYMKKLKEASDQKDFDRFLDYVVPRAKIPPCLPGKFLQGSKWYGTDVFAICEECWYEHVKDSVLDSQLTMRARFSNEAQACDLYSPRMKQEWAEACAKRNIGYFAQSAINRERVYSHVKERSEEIMAEINARKPIGGSGGMTIYKGPSGASGSGAYRYGNGNPRMRTGRDRDVMHMETSALNMELDELQRMWKAAE